MAEDTRKTRSGQMYPVLTTAEIARIARFGEKRRFARGESILRVGEAGHGMLVVLSGRIDVRRRDALGVGVALVSEGPGEFLAEIASLSGRAALVDADAAEDTEVLDIAPGRLRALIIAEADLGERITRALILRRVALIEAGVGGPVLVGAAQSPHLGRLRNFLQRNGHPHQVLDTAANADAVVLLEQFGAARGEVLVLCPDGSVLHDPDEMTLA